MDWFIKSGDGRESGPLGDDGVRTAVADGRVAALRRGIAKVWVPIEETPFAPHRAERRLADMTAKEARAVISDAVAHGMLKASIALIGLAMLVSLLYVLVLR